MATYNLCCDSTYGIVIACTKVDIDLSHKPLSDEVQVLPIENVISHVSTISYIDKKETVFYRVENVPDEIAAILELDQTRLIYDGKTFKQRPWIDFTSNDEYALKSGGLALPLNTDIVFTVTYNDPDNVGYDKILSHFKIKDRADFVNVNAETIQYDESGMTFTISSAFPGLTKIRLKDDKYLCYMAVKSYRFKQ